MNGITSTDDAANKVGRGVAPDISGSTQRWLGSDPTSRTHESIERKDRGSAFTRDLFVEKYGTDGAGGRVGYCPETYACALSVGPLRQPLG